MRFSAIHSLAAFFFCAGLRADPPQFAIRDDKGTFCQFEKRTANAAGAPAGYKVQDDRVDATVVSLGDDQWELALSVRGGGVREVWFPWPAQPFKPGAAENASVYAPQFGGTITPCDSLRDYVWQGTVYPNNCLAPLVIQADDKSGVLVASVMWPPRQVAPIYCRDRLALRFDEALQTGNHAKYRILLRQFEGDSANGRPPWLLAIGAYREWLQARMREERLLPVATPAWLKEADGWMQVNLADMPRFDAREVERQWQRYRHIFPWIQFWGQMSNYAGPSYLASPPLAPGEKAGCCLEDSRIHPRHADLPRLIRRIAAEGRVGLYARPVGESPRLDLRAAGGGPGDDLQGLINWTTRNRDEYGCNAHYLDIVGNKYCGDILTVAKALRERFPEGTVVEYGVDCYPAAMVFSGALSMGGTLSPQNAERAVSASSPFPRLGRALLNDRVWFMGGCNGDQTYWGRKTFYRAERNAFLLGAKLDVVELPDAPGSAAGESGPLNQAVEAVVAARRKVQWWQREPVYQDVLGIESVTAGVTVRRFTGKDGENLFVVDNWDGKPAPSFRFAGREIRMGGDRLMIAVLPK